MSKPVLWVVLAAAVSACAGTSRPVGPTSGGAVQEPQQPVEDAAFVMRVGERVALRSPALTIHLQRVDSDSRCPVDVTCIWAGDALVHLSLEGATGTPTAAALHVNPDLERAVVIDGRRISLLRLAPPPRTDRPIPQADYEVTLVVSRL